MSFSKAKLKRFNDIEAPVTDSPYADRAGERKESIKNLMKELSRDVKASSKDKKDKDKEAKEAKESKDMPAPAAVASDVEVAAKGESVFQRTRSLRLFRTPSLPKRLRFNRQHSDLTPKEKNQAAKALFPQPAAVPSTSPIRETPAAATVAPETAAADREALDAAQLTVRQQTEVLAERDAQLAELRSELERAQLAATEHSAQIVERDERIAQLASELSETTASIKSLSEASLASSAKVEQLESEIRQIVQNHENETDVLLADKADIEQQLARHSIEKKLLNEEVVVLKKELLSLHEEIRGVRSTLETELQQLRDSEERGARAATENLRLLDEIEKLKRQTDADMVAYVEEHQKMIAELEQLRRHKTAMCADLAQKAELIRGLQEELRGRDIEADGLRDELRAELLAESNGSDSEKLMADLRAEHEARVAELQSANARLAFQHGEQIEALRSALAHARETATDTIRIAEVQTEQRVKQLETTVDQQLLREKALWLAEMDKCQKIAETEIMQCEFEKADLKALLDGANELLRHKDDHIDELQTLLGNEVTKYVQCRDQFEQQLADARTECTRALTEKYNYHQTLNKTRETVNHLAERLKRSDTDGVQMREELEQMAEAKGAAEQCQRQMAGELQRLQLELEEYRQALAAIRASSMALQREVAEKESVFEQLMGAEQETLGTVGAIGKLFNDRIEENIVKYFELYTELKQRYDARERYVLDMKALLEEFTSGIELARLELDAKDVRLAELQEEVKSIKLENMTYKFKCEQFERYEVECQKEAEEQKGQKEQQQQSDDDGLVSTAVIANIIQQLENCDVSNHMGLYSDEDKISAENNMLKEKLAEKSRLIEQLQDKVNKEVVSSTTPQATEKKMTSTTGGKKATQRQIDQLKDDNMQLKNKIAILQCVNQEQEQIIGEINQSAVSTTTSTVSTTPRKMLNMSAIGSPKTPKTPRKYAGKENQLPLISHSPNVMRSRLIN